MVRWTWTYGRIRKYNDVRTPMLLTLAIYLDRMEYPPLDDLNVHRFVLAGLRIAAKFLEDLVWKHDRYAKVVGVSSRELSRLELGILPYLDVVMRGLTPMHGCSLFTGFCLKSRRIWFVACITFILSIFDVC